MRKKQTGASLAERLTDLPFQARIVAVCLIAVVLPVTLIFTLVSSFYIQYLDQQLISSEYRLLSQMAVNFENFHEELGNLCQDFTVNTGLKQAILSRGNARQNDALITAKMQSIMATHPELLGCYVFCQNGKQYKIQRRTGHIDSYREKPWYIAARVTPDTNMFFPADLLELYDDSTVAFTFQRGLTDANTGAFLGDILLTIDGTYLDGIFPLRTDIQPDALMVTDSSLRILYHSDPAFNNKLIVSSQFFTALSQNTQNYFVYRTGGKEIAVFYSVSTPNRFRVVELMPMNSFFRPVRQTEYAVIFLFILCLGFMAVLSGYLSSSVTTPIHRLTKKVEQFKNYDTPAPAKPPHRNEIMRLEESYEAMIVRIDGLIDNVYAAQIKQREAELNTLQSKINPHFLYNTLEMISAMASENSWEHVNNATTALSRLLRYSLRFENEVVTVREEMENVHNYLYIQKMRFKDRFHIVSDLPPEVLDYPVLKLVVQPLIENAIFHGLEPKRGEGIILISGHLLPDGGLELRVSDNGVGISYEDQAIIRESLASGVNGFWKGGATQDSHRGFALMNVHSRLQLKYGTASGLRIESSPSEGTTVTVIILAQPGLSDGGRKEQQDV